MSDVVEIVESEGGVELRLHGTVDVASAATLYAAACEVSELGDVSLAWNDVERIDISAFQILLALGREVTRSGYAWRTGAPSPAVVESLRLSGLTTAFTSS